MQKENKRKKKKMTWKSYLEIAFILGLVFVCTNAQVKVFDVHSYGAKADGKTDDSQAFLKAWTDACAWNGNATLLISLGVYMVNAADFSGPCKGLGITFEIRGVIKAPIDPKIYCNESWINFQHINGLEIKGHGTFDGQGAYAWGTHQCGTLPFTLGLYFIENGIVHDIHSENSKGVHINVYRSNNMKFRHVQIRAPRESPNTDGIHIGYSINIHIADSNIGTGDDCIALIGNSQNINITGVTCGPGHGISIGSLGQSSTYDVVKDIYVKNCTLINTQNGLRFKTWATTNSGMVSQITFKDISMIKAGNPIIIDQHYCPHGVCKQESSVQIKDVTFNNIWGSSSSKAAVTFDCSGSYPCTGIILKDINLVYPGPDGPATSSCAHAIGKAMGTELPPSCLNSSIDS